MAGKKKLSPLGAFIFSLAKEKYTSVEEIEGYAEKVNQLWAVYGGSPDSPIRFNRKIKKKCPSFNDVSNFSQLGSDFEERNLVVKVKKDWYSLSPLLQDVLSGKVNVSKAVLATDKDAQKLEKLAEFLMKTPNVEYYNKKEARKYAGYVLLIYKIETSRWFSVTELERIRARHPDELPADLEALARDMHREKKIIISPGRRFDFKFSASILKFLEKLE